MMTVPRVIIDLAQEAVSHHNDGFTMERARQMLREMRDYIDGVLEDDEGSSLIYSDLPESERE